MEKINERIRKLRKELKVSQEAFGNKIGIKKASVSLIEKGINNPSEQTIKSICREYNISIAWLKDGIGDMFTNLPETLLDELANEYNLNDQMKKLIKTLLELDENSQNTLINILEKTFSK